MARNGRIGNRRDKVGALRNKCKREEFKRWYVCVMLRKQVLSEDGDETGMDTREDRERFA